MRNVGIIYGVGADAAPRTIKLDVPFEKRGYYVRCQAVGPVGPILFDQGVCYQRDICDPETGYVLPCPDHLKPTGSATTTTTTPKPPRYPLILIALIAAGAYVIFGGKKD